jgi:hypothetical protein
MMANSSGDNSVLGFLYLKMAALLFPGRFLSQFFLSESLESIVQLEEGIHPHMS